MYRAKTQIFFFFNIEHTYYPEAEGKQEHITLVHRAEEEGNKGKRIRSGEGEQEYRMRI